MRTAKRFLAFIMACLMFGGVFALADDAGTPVPGDVTADGYVTNGDLILTARYVVDLVEFDDAQLKAADINGDNTVSNADIIGIGRAVVGLTPTTEPAIIELPKVNGEVPIPEERLIEMNRAFAAKKNTDISYIKSYGRFDGCDVVFIRGKGMYVAMSVPVEAAGWNFTFPDPGAQMYVFKGNDFLRIDEAYEAGWISAEGVEMIWLLGDIYETHKFERVDGVYVPVFDKYVSFFNGMNW